MSTYTVEVTGDAVAIEVTIEEVIVAISGQGPRGVGVVPGGTTGQILAKKTDADFDAEWVNQPAAYGPSIQGTPLAPVEIDPAIGIPFTGINPINIWFIKGSAGADIDISTTQIALGYLGQRLTLVRPLAVAGDVLLEDGNGIQGGDWAGQEGQVLELLCDAVRWVMIGRNT